MKPKWKDAPKEAKYMAMDSDGEWHWFAKKPISEIYISVLPLEGVWMGMSRLYEKPCIKGWEKSLEKRP